MYYKQYGNTGLKVSAIGLGTMRYDEEDIKAGRLEKCAEIPLYAFEKGIIRSAIVTRTPPATSAVTLQGE